MTFEEFRASLKEERPPAALDTPLQALWWDAKGDWDSAHACVQSGETPDSCLIHAYLHRKEGDLGNAAYWYRRAGKSPSRGETGEEWSILVRAMLNRQA